MSLTDPEFRRLAEIRVLYYRALSLTKDLLNEVRDRGKELDLEYLSQRLEKREAALDKAFLATQGFFEDHPRSGKLKPELRSIRQVARETYELGAELIGMLNKVRDETGDELGRYESGNKLMKGYMGFKAKVALRFDRQI